MKGTAALLALLLMMTGGGENAELAGDMAGNTNEIVVEAADGIVAEIADETDGKDKTAGTGEAADAAESTDDAETAGVAAAADEDDWLYEYRSQYGGIALTAYLGSDSTVVVPSEIGGKKVVALHNTFRQLAVYDEDGELIAVEPFEVAWDRGGDVHRKAAPNETLEEVVVPEGVKTIGNGAFENCTSLRRVSLPQSLEWIDEYAFAGCTSLERIELPVCVKWVSYRAFKDCSSLSEVIFPEALDSIGSGAFMGTSLTQVSLPEQAVRNSSLDFVFDSGTLVNGVATEYPEDRTSDDGFSYRLYARRGYAEIERYDGSETDLVVPSEIDGWPVTAIHGLHGENVDKIERVVFPEGLTDIEDFMCDCMSSLREVVLPQGLTRIGRFAFAGCRQLEHIDIPQSVKSIGEYAFENTGLTEVTVARDAWCNETAFEPEVVVHGGYYDDTPLSLEDDWRSTWYSYHYDENWAELGYYGGTEKNVVLPSLIDGMPLTVIGEYALSEKPMATAVIPEGVEEIGDYAFACCKSLERVVLPQSLKRIGAYAFGGCDNLERVELPEGIEVVDDHAFSAMEMVVTDDYMHYTLYPDEGYAVLEGRDNDTDLEITEYVIPAEFDGLPIRRIGFEAFFAMHIEHIDIPEGVEEIGEYAFDWCKQLESVAFPGTLKRIGDHGFAYCVKLRRIELPEGLEEIGEQAFEGCKQLKNVTFPSTLKRIESEAFKDCEKLRTVKLPEGIEYVAEDAFEETTRVIWPSDV